MDTVGTRIRRIREFRGMTQKELALKAGINEALMRRYEYGDRKPKEPQLRKIADALCVSAAFFSIPNVQTFEGLFALLFEFVERFGDVSLDINGGDISITLPVKSELSVSRPLIDAAYEKNAIEDPALFQNWLLDYRKAHLKKIDFSEKK